MIGIGILNSIGWAPLNGTIDDLAQTLEYHFGYVWTSDSFEYEFLVQIPGGETEKW